MLPPFPNGRTRAAIFEYGRHLIVAFYCNIPIVSTKKSRLIEGGEDLNAGVASEALHAWRAIEPDLNTSIKKHMENFKGRILITGHSTGGALAVLQAGYLAQFIPSHRLSCITFGAPKFAGRRFVDRFAQIGIENYRIFNERDPVPSFPSLFPQLHHPQGIEILLPAEYSLESNEPWWQFWCNENIYDHKITAYSDGIARFVGSLS